MRGLRRESAQRGISFIEVMVALVIMMMVAGGVSRLLVRSWQSEEVTNDQNLAQKTAQQAVDAIVDRLRAGTEVASGDAGQVTVGYRSGDTVSFSLEGSALQRSYHSAASGQTTTAAAVPSFLTRLALEYRQRDGTGWREAVPASLADLVIVSVTAACGRCHATETSVVELRNKT